MLPSHHLPPRTFLYSHLFCHAYRCSTYHYAVTAATRIRVCMPRALPLLHVRAFRLRHAHACCHAHCRLHRAFHCAWFRTMDYGCWILHTFGLRSFTFYVAVIRFTDLLYYLAPLVCVHSRYTRSHVTPYAYVARFIRFLLHYTVTGLVLHCRTVGSVHTHTHTVLYLLIDSLVGLLHSLFTHVCSPLRFAWFCGYVRFSVLAVTFDSCAGRYRTFWFTAHTAHTARAPATATTTYRTTRHTLCTRGYRLHPHHRFTHAARLHLHAFSVSTTTPPQLLHRYAPHHYTFTPACAHLPPADLPTTFLPHGYRLPSLLPVTSLLHSGSVTANAVTRCLCTVCGFSRYSFTFSSTLIVTLNLPQLRSVPTLVGCYIHVYDYTAVTTRVATPPILLPFSPSLDRYFYTTGAEFDSPTEPFRTLFTAPFATPHVLDVDLNERYICYVVDPPHSPLVRLHTVLHHHTFCTLLI